MFLSVAVWASQTDSTVGIVIIQGVLGAVVIGVHCSAFCHVSVVGRLKDRSSLDHSQGDATKRCSDIFDLIVPVFSTQL